VKSKDIVPRTVERNKQITTTMKAEPMIAPVIADPPITLAKANLLPTVLHLVHWI